MLYQVICGGQPEMDAKEKEQKRYILPPGGILLHKLEMISGLVVLYPSINFVSGSPFVPDFDLWRINNLIPLSSQSFTVINGLPGKEIFSIY